MRLFQCNFIFDDGAHKTEMSKLILTNDDNCDFKNELKSYLCSHEKDSIKQLTIIEVEDGQTIIL